MKTAEEWDKEWETTTSHYIARECWDKSDFELAHNDFIQQIQLDAMKEGMRRAATVCRSNHAIGSPMGEATAINFQKTLLTSAEQLTIKDL